MERNKNESNFRYGALPGASAPLAIAYVPMQSSATPAYEAAEALSRGTLFPGLDLPFMNIVNDTQPVTPLTELMAIDFVTDELELYLDTHADDKEACNAQFAEIRTEQTALKEQKEEILQSSADADRVCTRMKQAEQAVENAAQTITEWNENAVRQIVERVTVLSANEILVRIKGGAEIKQRLE